MGRGQKILTLLYELLDIEGEPVFHVEQDAEDGTWSAELEADGKLVENDCDGLGETVEEAIEDAVSRFFDHTPVVNDVPLRKLISLLALSSL